MSGILLAEHSPPTACRRVVSGTISLPSQGFFSPFPHGTGSLSVASEYLALPDGPGGFKQGFSCPALLRSHWKEDCIFTYAAVTLSGRPFQTVQLTLSYPSFHLLDPLFRKRPVGDCGPATPGSPCGSPGLGSSEFARHYYRNHGCFLLLRVLRWFTSPGLPVHPIYSDARNECSHSLGFPIRKSPDHSLLAASRSLSQLITSFFAYLRLGIHTHALSSLTIKSTSHTNTFFTASTALFPFSVLTRSPFRRAFRCLQTLLSTRLYTCVYNARQYSVVKDLDCLSNQFQRSLSFRSNSLLIPYFSFGWRGGPRWNRTIDLTLIRGAL